MLDTITDNVLEFYAPGFRFIKSIHPDYPKTTGIYELPPKQYLREDSTMLTGVSSIILMSQATIIGISYLLHQKKIPGLEKLSLSTMQEIGEFCSNTVVCRYDNVCFKKIAWKEDADKTFEFTITKYRASKSLDKIFVYVDYVIGDQKMTGTWTLAYVSNKNQR